METIIMISSPEALPQGFEGLRFRGCGFWGLGVLGF